MRGLDHWLGKRVTVNQRHLDKARVWIVYDYTSQDGNWMLHLRARDGDGRKIAPLGKCEEVR